MTTSDGSSGPHGTHDSDGPTENMPAPYPPYPPYPGYPPPYPGAAPGQPYAQQPPYGPPPMYPAYPGYPPLPQKKSNRTLWIVLGVVGGVLLLCVICGVAGIFLVQSVLKSPVVGATITVSEFCADEQTQQYTSAYDLFSPNLQSQITQDDFVSRAQRFDAANGMVSDCTPSTSSAQVNDTTATFTLSVVRGGSLPSTSTGDDSTPPSTGASPTATAATGTTTPPTTSTGTITLVENNGDWQIDAIDSSLGLM